MYVAGKIHCACTAMLYQSSRNNSSDALTSSKQCYRNKKQATITLQLTNSFRVRPCWLVSDNFNPVSDNFYPPPAPPPCGISKISAVLFSG